MSDAEKDPGLLPPIPEEAAIGLPDPRNLFTPTERAAHLERLRILAEQRRRAADAVADLPLF